MASIEILGTRIEVMEQSLRSTARVLRERRGDLPKLTRSRRGKTAARPRSAPAAVRKAA